MESCKFLSERKSEKEFLHMKTFEGGVSCRPVVTKVVSLVSFVLLLLRHSLHILMKSIYLRDVE